MNVTENYYRGTGTCIIKLIAISIYFNTVAIQFQQGKLNRNL